MKITTYFIKHPVTAVILNCMIILLGILCFNNLKIREYPDIILPTIFINAVYPNASAELVESSLTNILEDQLAGVENLDSMISSSEDNFCRIELKFKAGSSADRALIKVKDAVTRAKVKLPIQVKEPLVEQGSSEGNGPPFMAVCLESSSMDFGELTHYVKLGLVNSLRSIKGVASTEIYGRPYTYRVTLDHQKMYKLGINADEIYNAIERSNLTRPLGKFQRELPVTLNSELASKEDFENILVKDGQSPIFLKSLAKIELSTEDQKMRLKINGKPGLCVGVKNTQDDNPLEVSDLVRKQVDELKTTMPSDINMMILLDQAEYIRASLANIKSSIIEAILLVLVIIFVFLRNVRATLIPIVTIPISLIGSLIFLSICGFSINIMTLLAMVLAVGLVVDDAIVVLENITRHIENGDTVLQASIKGAKEIGFAIVAMTLTLTSVYMPIAFITGMIGQLFIEFSAALAGSVLISGIVAITLSPLMCAKVLRAKEHNILPQIDVFMENLSLKYTKLLDLVINYKKLMLVFLSISLLITITCFKILPKETAPGEDRSLIGVLVPTIAGKNIDNFEKDIEAVEAAVKDLPEAQANLTFITPNGGYVILPLKSIEQRKRSANQIVGALQPQMMAYPSLDAWVWSWSTSLPGMDNASESSDLTMIVSTTDSYEKLLKEINKARKIGEDNKIFDSLRHDLKLDNLGMVVNLDKDTLAKLNLSEAQIAKMIEIFFSGNTALEFKMDGILYPITIEGDIRPWSLNELYLTNPHKQRISIASFAKLDTKAIPKKLSHYNQMRSVSLTANLSSKDNIVESMDKLRKLADENLPKSYKKQWTGLAKTYAETSTSTSLLFLLSLLFIYAILAVQFESFLDPLIVLLTVPLACSGAMAIMYFSGSSLNIYSQVGLITLIGLISKHGILIVEFANQLHLEGKSLLEAIKTSASLRLRPILMTTSAMICGAVPLIISTSAGSEARHAIGVVLISGLFIGTIFTLFVLPSVYYILKSLKR